MVCYFHAVTHKKFIIVELTPFGFPAETNTLSTWNNKYQHIEVEANCNNSANILKCFFLIWNSKFHWRHLLAFQLTQCLHWFWLGAKQATMLMQICHMDHIMWCEHYSNVTMGAVASQITGIWAVWSVVGSGVHQRKHQSCASLALVRGVHQKTNNAEKVSIWWRYHDKALWPLNNVFMFKGIPSTAINLNHRM